MLFELPLPILLSILLSLLLLFFYLGSLVNRIKSKNGESPRGSTFFVEGTLLSLLLSFTFGSAANKYDKRRTDLTNEVNNISTVLTRTRLYPDSISRELMSYLKPYLESRIEYYKAGDDQLKIDKSLTASDSISTAIFSKVSLYAQRPEYLPYTQQMVPALGKMSDIVTEREVFRKAVVPRSVLNLLLVVSLIVSFLNGTNQKRDKVNWVQAIGFSLLIVFSFLLITDFNNNRNGKINLDAVEKNMENLQRKIKWISHTNIPFQH